MFISDCFALLVLVYNLSLLVLKFFLVALNLFSVTLLKCFIAVCFLLREFLLLSVGVDFTLGSLILRKLNFTFFFCFLVLGTFCGASLSQLLLLEFGGSISLLTLPQVFLLQLLAHLSLLKLLLDVSLLLSE